MIKPRNQMEQLCLYDVICEISATEGRLEFWSGIERCIQKLNEIGGQYWIDDELDTAESIKEAARELMTWLKEVSKEREHEKANLSTLNVVLRDKLSAVGGFDE